MVIKVEDFNDFMFSLLHHAGSCHHTTEVEKFIEEHGCNKEFFRALSDYMNESQRKCNELFHLKHKIREGEIKRIKSEMPDSDIAEWILDNFERKD